MASSDALQSQIPRELKDSLVKPDDAEKPQTISDFNVAATDALNDMPEDIRRGVPLRHLLANFGRVIRVMPHEMQLDERARLYELSLPVETLSFFLSHCWTSPGWFKYVTLVMRFLGVWVLIGASLAALCVLLMQFCCIELPNLSSRREGIFNLTFEISQWEFYAGAFSASGVAMLGHFACWADTSTCFLDAACVHQTDVAKQQRAINCIAGFVRTSKTLLALWDPIYLTRGWCAYELAAFIATHGGDRVEILPIKTHFIALGMLSYYFIGYAAFLILWPVLPSWYGFDAITIVASYPFFTFCAVMSESLVDDLSTLTLQLEGFDVRECCFTMESDREVVLNRIAELYSGGISEFNRIMQGDIKEMVVSTFTNQRSPLPYHLYLLANLPCILGSVTFISTFRHAPIQYQLSYFVFASTYVGACFPIVVAIVMMLGRRLAAPEQETSTLRPRHFAIGLLGSTVMLAWINVAWFVPCMVASGTLPSVSTNPWHGPLLAVAISLFTWPWVWFFYGHFDVQARAIRHTYHHV